MQLPDPLQPAKLIRRYKRFLADIELPGGETITIHCPNTGSMKNCQEPGSRVWYSLSDNKKRKYPGTWQVVEVDEGKGKGKGEKQLVGINTGLSNKLVTEAIASGSIKQLENYDHLRTEVRYGDQNSRIDILLENVDGADCYIEVKNVSLGMGEGLGTFPDAVTLRGQKHLQELMAMRKAGSRAVLLFCVQHQGIQRVAPADDIDPEYGRLLRLAAGQGVEVLAYGAHFDIAGSAICLDRELAVEL